MILVKAKRVSNTIRGRRRVAAALGVRIGGSQASRQRCGLRSGFTLIEVMVILVIMAILALIIIPQILGATRRSNEAALRGDLRNFRTAIERFQADCGGYPPRLDDIFAWSGSHVSAGVDGAGHDLDLSSYRGPYLRTGDMLLPYDPITNRRDWRYSSATGEVHPGADSTGTDGRPYSEW